jgi:hypothetical protein
VLHGGGVLVGQISVVGEHYVVTRSNSVVEVSAGRVMLVADSLVDAHSQQRRRLPRETAEAHCALAEWCLRHDLFESAARELADARRLDPREPQVALLERRLAVARQRILKRPGGATAATISTVRSTDEHRELEAVAAELPEGTVERFARKVQPLLVNNCTTTGCHQPSGSQDFQLDRALLHGLSNRRTTLRNLVATLELVDHEAPQRSRLLRFAGRRHGGMKQAILGPRQERAISAAP